MVFLYDLFPAAAFRGCCCVFMVLGNEVCSITASKVLAINGWCAQVMINTWMQSLECLRNVRFLHLQS